MKLRGKAAWANFAALVLVNLLWAAQYPAYKIAGDSMGSAALNFWTLLFASILLLPLWLREKKQNKRAPRAFEGKIVGEYLLLGLIGIIPPTVMLAWGIAHSSASNAAILSLMIPVLMTAFGFLMLKEKLTPARIACLFLGLAGTLLVSTNDLSQASLSRKLLVGNIVILLGGAGSAFYNTYSKELLSRFSELEILLYSYAVGGAACAILSTIFEARPFYLVTGYSTATWLAIIILGVLSWGLAMILWMWVLNRLEVGQISISIYLLPLFGLIFSMSAGHERITLPQVLGGVLTVVATAVLTAFETRRSAQQNDLTPIALVEKH